MTKHIPRNLDHLVLPVPSLDIARNRLSALGFTVAPDGRHSFGSENCCVYFGNGTYLEPLAIGHRETVEAAMIKGNIFLERDHGYRFRQGDNGFSAVCFGGTDVKAERKKFRKAGYRTGKTVLVKRPGLKVRTVFAVDERAPDFSLFRCERSDGPPKFPEAMCKHSNGALRIAQVSVYEDEPSDFQYYLQMVSGIREIRSHSFGLEFSLPNASLQALNESGMRAYYGANELPEGRGMRALAFDVEVENLEKVSDLLSGNGIEHQKFGQRLVVAAAEGQGSIIAFVEKS